MNEIAFNILADTLEMTMDTQKEELNFSKKSSDVDESTVSLKLKLMTILISIILLKKN